MRRGTGDNGGSTREGEVLEEQEVRSRQRGDERFTPRAWTNMIPAGWGHPAVARTDGVGWRTQPQVAQISVDVVQPPNSLHQPRHGNAGVCAHQ